MTNVDCGRSLMNLEYVLVNNIHGEDPGSLFGIVTVDDGWYTHTFYDRSQKVGPGGFVTLTDSSHPFPVYGADAFVINLDLFNHTDKNGKRVIAHGEIVWDAMIESVTLQNYDKHLEREVEGAHGNITVGYSVLTNALAVTIQLLSENGDGESTAEVYGTLTASQLLGGSDGLAPITLLDKSLEDCVRVRKGEPIPLTRKVIAVSTSTTLKITAKLRDNNPGSPNAVIADGSVEFMVKPGKQSQNINGGHVQVIITCE